MKKILNKILKKQTPEPPSKITAETVAEHREQILAGGRRFKYPLQYSRHKLVFNAIIISVAALLLVLLFGWWRLYVSQDTGVFFYRVTRFIPVPVARVDGKAVPYSDYLMAFRSSVNYSRQKEQLNEKSDDGKTKIRYYKQQSMQGAIANAYAAKLAKELSITVTDSELEGLIREQRQSSNGESSQEAFDAVILDYYGWGPSEYRHVVSSELLRQKVAYAMDKPALAASNGALALIASGAGTDFTALATNISGQFNVKATYGSSGWVPKTNQDGGLSAAASKLTKGQTSAPVKSSKGDGYYILRLLDINDSQVSYEYINIPLTIFQSQLDQVKSSGKVKMYINIDLSFK